MPEFGQNNAVAQRNAIARINATIGEARKAYITDLPGQDMLYVEKRDEAREWIAAGEPADLTNYPLLASETGITAPTAWEVAQIWINTPFMWKQVAGPLEGLRLGSVYQVEAATTRAEIDAALAAFTLALGALPA